MELITQKDERIDKIMSCLANSINAINNLIEKTISTFDGEYYLTDYELSEKIKISRRTLQEYRNQGILPYIHLGGKIIYKASDIENILNNTYIKAWEEQ